MHYRGSVYLCRVPAHHDPLSKVVTGVNALPDTFTKFGEGALFVVFLVSFRHLELFPRVVSFTNATLDIGTLINVVFIGAVLSYCLAIKNPMYPINKMFAA